MKLILPNPQFGSLKEVEEYLKKEKNVRVLIKLQAIRMLMLGIRDTK